MIWSATIGFLELFVLPALAAILANYAFGGSGKQRGVRLTALIVAAYCTAFAVQYIRTKTSKPSAMVMGQDLALSFRGNDTSRLVLTYDVLVFGDSTSGVTLIDLTGNLKAGDQFQAEERPLALNDFKCSVNGKPLVLPIAIAPGASERFDCSVDVTLTKAQAANLLAAGDHRLTVRLPASSSNELVGAYCFVLTQNAVDELTTSGSLNRRFLDAEC